MKTTANKTRHPGSYIVDDKGRKKSVILDLKTYEELLEDLEDLRLVAERKNEPASSLEQVEKRLKKHGLL
jgi:PHD/YefM family antitoxin component YafN of YafNO toxin-antitoxin module